MNPRSPCPHAPSEKAAGLAQAPFGVVGLETALAVALTELYHTGLMSLPDLLATMTCHPARLFSLPGGRLTVGALADVTIFDPQATWTVAPDRFYSLGRNTPFAGRELRGKPWGTILAGRFAFREGQVL